MSYANFDLIPYLLETDSDRRNTIQSCMMNYLIMDLVSHVQKFPKNKDVTAINICNGQTDSFVEKHLRSKKCQPCSGSDEAVKRKMFGSMKTARRAMRLGDVKTDRDKATSYFSLRIGKLTTRWRKIRYRVYNSKNIINVSESLLVHEIQVSTFRSGKVVRLVMSLLPNDNLTTQKNKKQRHIPFTCD